MIKNNSRTKNKMQINKVGTKTNSRDYEKMLDSATLNSIPKFELSETEHVPFLNRRYKVIRETYKDLNVGFVPLRPNSKIEFIDGDFNTSNNIGVRISSESNFFVLDLDVKNPESSLESQLDYFSELFNVDLRKTFTISTPSGGLHCYLYLPEGLNFGKFPYFPKGNLNKGKPNEALKSILSSDVIIDCDIRTSESGGYFLAPTSVIDGVEYSPVNIKTPILTIGEKGVENIGLVSDLIESKSSVRTRNVNSSNVLNEDNKIHVMPPSKDIKAFAKSLKETHSESSYHAKRAKLITAFFCCYSVEVLEKLCVTLGIDKDTHRKGRMSARELRYDVVNFIPDYAGHGLYCEIGKRRGRSVRKPKIVYTEEKLEELAAYNRKRVAERKIARNPEYQRVYPRVLDIALISSTLLTGSNGRMRRKSQQYFDALNIVENFTQVLSNVGVKIIVLARDAISSRLNITESRTAAALRLLRESGVLVIHSKPQTGLATTYVVPEKFTHPTLTKSLRMAWGFNGVEQKDTEKKFHANIYLDRNSLTFREVFTNKPVTTNTNYISTKIQKMNESIVENESSSYDQSVALSYLKCEATARGVEVVKTDDGYSMINTETGEIVEEAPLPKTVIDSNADKKVLSNALTKDEELEIENLSLEIELDDLKIVDESYLELFEVMGNINRDFEPERQRILEEYRDRKENILKNQSDSYRGVKTTEDVSVLHDSYKIDFKKSLGQNFMHQSTYDSLRQKRRPPP